MSPSEGDVALFLEKAGIYGLKKIKLISHGVSGITYLISTRKEKYVLILFTKELSSEEVVYTSKINRYFASEGFPIPKIITAGLIGGKHALLTEFVKGKVHTNLQPSDYHSIGFLIGNMHKVGKTLPPPPGSMPLILKLKEEFYSHKDSYPEEFLRLEDEILSLEEVWPMDLPKSIVHNDYWYKSFLFQESKIAAIVDFHSPSYDLCILDIANLVKGICFKRETTLPHYNFIEPLLEGYSLASPITNEEISSLGLMLQCKVISTILYMLKSSQKKGFQETDFRTIALFYLFKLDEAKAFNFNLQMA